MNQKLGLEGIDDNPQSSESQVGMGLGRICSVRKTKIMCTLGNNTMTKEGIQKLLDKGMDIARINMSYISHHEHQKQIETIQ
jgi:hypothetical protein